MRSIDIVAVQADADSAGHAFDVLVAQGGGHFQCLSGDLKTQRWVEDIANTDISNGSCTVVDVESARKGLLKGRADVLASLDPALSSTSLLCAFSNRRMMVFTIRPRSVGGITSQRSGLYEVLSSELPGSSTRLDSPTYSLYAATGKLHELSSGVITTFDLAGTIPRVESVLSTTSTESPFTSFTRISNSTLLTTSNDSCILYETIYGSVQASLQLSSGLSAETAGDKRKHSSDGTQNTALELVSYFADLDLAVGLSGHEIVALQFASDIRKTKRARSRGTVLADVLGKGQPTSDVTGNAQINQKWESWKTEVDGLIDSNNIEALEQMVGRNFGATKTSKGVHQREGVVKVDTTDADAGSIDGNQPSWNFPSDPVVLLSRTDRWKASYLLRKIFVSTQDEQPISIDLFAPSIFRWLVQAGCTSRAALQHVLGTDIRPGDLMNAIEDFDPDFRLAYEVLSWPVHLEIGEVVQALRLLVQSFNTPDPEASRLALLAAANESEMTDADQNSLDSTFEAESMAAESEWQHAMSALDSGLEVRSDAFRLVLARLHAFPQKEVATTMRAMMARQDIVFFIHILRIELADGGWTSRYTDAQDVSGADLAGPSDHAITTIGELLNCAVDAIGTGGWLVGLSSDVLGTEEMLASLRAEISAGLEGCYEAHSLSSFLCDFENHGKAAPNTSTALGSLDNENMVPLSIGNKANRAVSQFYDGTGGKEGKKSKRVIGLERSMRVGKYSIERIRL